MSEPIPAAELAAFREVMSSATPGPWVADKDGEVFPVGEDGEPVIHWEIAAVVSDNPDNAQFIAQSREMCVRLLDKVDRLKTWSGLMSVLDQFYPADVFDGSSGDPGARIVALTREVDRLRAENERLRSDDKLTSLKLSEIRRCLPELKTAISVFYDTDVVDMEVSCGDEGCDCSECLDSFTSAIETIVDAAIDIRPLVEEIERVRAQDAVATRRLVEGE